MIRKEIEKLVPAGANFSVERTANPELGDYSSNIALMLSKKVGKNPHEVAKEMKSQLLRRPTSKLGEVVERIEVAGPGFLNFWIQKEALTSALGKNASFKVSRLQKINLEFVSANPTGPLTMANGRGGFYGDALANILEAVGHKVTREYYVNDTGHQIKSLGLSIWTVRMGGILKEGHYKGEYIYELAKDKRLAKFKVADYLGKAAAKILLEEIKKSLKSAGIRHDEFFSEDKNLHKKGELKEMLEFLNKKKILKEKEGALWWDERVVIKSNGEPTYLLADLAYHRDKLLKREFDLAITVVGADHHAEIKQVEEKVKVFGTSPERLKIIVIQLVRLVSKGKEVKMSKRAGEFVTLDDLLKEVGVGVARWFFLERSPDTHMDFDLDLAKERSRKNPVYYVQYAHARACSILRKSEARSTTRLPDGQESETLNLLIQPEELTLIKKILQLPEIVEDISKDYQVHRLPRYAYELAQVFTNFYEKHHVIDPKNPDLTQARLALVSATQKTLKQALGLMGIDSPNKM